jgi:hypothetical protein
MGEENGKRLATAAELMAARPGHVDVDVDAWGARVRLVRLDGPAKLRTSLAAEGISEGDREAFYSFGIDLLADSIVDENGVKQFATPEAKAWLSGEIAAVGQLVTEATRLNGLGASAVADQVEAARKNSEPPPGDVSPIG